MKAVSPTVMQGLDQATIDAGTPGDDLMERAGYGAFLELLDFADRLHPNHVQRYLVLCGKGNNGGDGYVIARYLFETNLPVTVVSTCPVEELQGDALINATRLDDVIPLLIQPEDIDDLLDPGTIVVDALLGTGISGPVREPAAGYVRSLNASDLPTVAIDVPSGLNADTGEVAEDAVVADLTLTMGLPKAGLFLNDGSAHTGRLTVIDIGIVPEEIDRADSPFDVVTASDAAQFLPRLGHLAHKGTQGRVLVVGGCSNFPGAPLLTGMAAARSGAGLVSVAFPQTIAPMMARGPAALIVQPMDDRGEGTFSDVDPAALIEVAAKQDVLVVGPGLGESGGRALAIAALLELQIPLVLDADGLIQLENHDLLKNRTAPLVVTPHPGEMRRLLEALDMADLQSEPRIVQTRGVAQRLRAIVALKGTHTVVAAPDGRVSVNSSGSSALATGGTGDVLAGMIGAFVHHLDDPFDAVRLAVFVHGRAAESVSSRRAMVADDLLDRIGPAMAGISPHA